MIEFLSDNIWKEIVKAAKKSKSRRVVVPYYSYGNLIEYKKDDVLIVDASDRSIKAGQTDAKILKKTFDNGCLVYSNNHLHAKIYLFNNIVFVGSNNASVNSKESLIESAIVTDHPTAISGASQMIAQLQKISTKVDKSFIDRVIKLPVEKKFPGPKKPKPKIDINKPRAWIINGGREEEYPGDEEQVEAKVLDLQKEFDDDSSEKKDIDWIFSWGNGRFHREAQVGDLLIYISKPTFRTKVTTNVRIHQARIIYKIEKKPERKNLRVYYCIYPQDLENTFLSWSKFLSAAKQAQMNYKFKTTTCREVNYKKSLLLQEIWHTFL